MPRITGTALVLLFCLLLWQTLHLLVGASSLASPFQTVVKLGSLLATAEFWQNVAETMRAFAAAFLISLVGGIALGILLGVRRLAGNVAEPILVNLYSIPKVVLYPLVLLCFGLGISAKIAFGVMHGLIPITLFSMNAIRQMKPVYRRTAQVLRLSSAQSAFTVILPAILPEVISGVRLGFSLTLLGVLIGEMFASQRGLGFMLISAINIGQIDTIMAVALLLTIVAVTCNSLLLLLNRRMGYR
ncbi:NitT/TauT family transport system permease protein [Bosea sp. OAE752]|uniref:ABC transporter permease subunit n=1 Tax=Bosea spartocytisi TaxID=2773451 RepID=A0A927E8Y4_9HYPH|nr:ABC transporter permease subunit [Bosea spartocytisi]MBD3846533.1 ABC transporter permease subunit [Bosea spartocytisi]MCT4472078.1 ABC transporter permease subunit [Bosea spartocytisi]